MAQQNQPFENPMFREIHKNAWLKKIAPNNSKKKRDKLWIVFCVHDDTDVYLEAYANNKLAVFHKPEWFISLNNIQHISPTICAQDQDYEFVLTFSDDVIRLAASSWEQMSDWVESLKSKLSELRILSPRENVYTKLPEKPQQQNVSLLPTRDPMSPLPPTPPEEPLDLLLGVERLNNTGEVTTNRQLDRRVSEPQTSATLTANPSSSSSGSSSSNANEPLSTDSGSYSSIFNFNNLNHSLETVNSSSIISLHYEHLFNVQPGEPGPSSRDDTRQLVRSTLTNSTNRLLERSASCSPKILKPPPTPCRTLREQQVLVLQKEMRHPTGVRVQLRRKDCLSSIGFVDAFDAVWVCGWKQKEHPMLYNALHIGDRLISIEGITVISAANAQKILQSDYCGLYVNLIIKRMPFGQVFVIHRETEGQPLGIVQENNTAVIETVEENSLAARCGLTAKAKCCDGTSFTNWVLTEINGRPLNLFFKKTQIRDRLNAVGKDISILVQPLDLIKQLKKQMKSLKNYKDYILQ